MTQTSELRKKKKKKIAQPQNINPLTIISGNCNSIVLLPQYQDIPCSYCCQLFLSHCRHKQCECFTCRGHFEHPQQHAHQQRTHIAAMCSVHPPCTHPQHAYPQLVHFATYCVIAIFQPFSLSTVPVFPIFSYIFIRLL